MPDLVEVVGGPRWGATAAAKLYVRLLRWQRPAWYRDRLDTRAQARPARPPRDTRW